MKNLATKICFTSMALSWSLFAQNDIQISGKVMDASGTAISGAEIILEHASLSATSGADGSFTLGEALSINPGKELLANSLVQGIVNGQLNLNIEDLYGAKITAYSPNGKYIPGLNRHLQQGQHKLGMPTGLNGLVVFNISTSSQETTFKASVQSGSILAIESKQTASIQGPLHKQAVISDVLSAKKDGYLDFYMHMTESSSSNLEVVLTAEGELDPFSFFVTSLKALQELSGSEEGFGGDFRFGETGPGAGLRGADKICAAIAEMSMPGSSAKGWRAFLSATDDGNGETVNAADRIGEGPWYDRLGRIVSENKTGLLQTRPDADEAIMNDLPNENGIPNQDPDLTGAVDNHHTLTGSDGNGELYSEDMGNTCNDWTNAEEETGTPRVGLSWPRNFGGGGGFPGGGGDANSNWISAGNAYGCAPGVALIQDGPGNMNIKTVGEGGGYGGFYCLALNP